MLDKINIILKYESYLTFLNPFGGAVRGLEDRGFIGEEDFLKFSFSFSSLFIDLNSRYFRLPIHQSSIRLIR